MILATNRIYHEPFERKQDSQWYWIKVETIANYHQLSWPFEQGFMTYIAWLSTLTLLIRLPGTVSNGLNARQSEIFTKMLLKTSDKLVEYIQCLFSNVGFSVTYQNAETFQNAQARIICPLKNQIKFFNHLTFLNKYLMLCRRFNEQFSGILVRISKYWAFSLFETVPGCLIRSLQFLSV